MSSSEGIETNCECQYTLTLMEKVVQGQFSEMKDNFNHVPSIHEVDEEDTDEEYTCEATPKYTDQITDIRENGDDESIYGDESFCSDNESCEESEETNATSRSFNDSHFSPESTECMCLDEDTRDEKEAYKSIMEDNESENSIHCKSLMSEDKSVDFKQAKSRRRNMTFTDEEMRKIEWENQLLLRKIMSQQRPKERILQDNMSQSRISSSAVNRKKLQRKIENENILMLQRIQQTKSRVMNTMTKPGCRHTFL